MTRIEVSTNCVELPFPYLSCCFKILFLLQNMARVSEQRQHQLEEIALVAEENKRLQETVADLQASLLQERHHREDLQVSVEALRKEKEQLESENRQLVEETGRRRSHEQGALSPLVFLSFDHHVSLMQIHLRRAGGPS